MRKLGKLGTIDSNITSELKMLEISVPGEHQQCVTLMHDSVTI